jgi:hypothetical protein
MEAPPTILHAIFINPGACSRPVSRFPDRSSRPRGQTQPQQFCGFHDSGEVPSGLDNGLIWDWPSRMFAVVNPGPDDLRRRARQLTARGHAGPRRSLGTSLPGHAVQLGSRHRQVQIVNRPRLLNGGVRPRSSLRRPPTAGLPSTADLLTDGRHRRSDRRHRRIAASLSEIAG